MVHWMNRFSGALGGCIGKLNVYGGILDGYELLMVGRCEILYLTCVVFCNCVVVISYGLLVMVVLWMFIVVLCVVMKAFWMVVMVDRYTILDVFFFMSEVNLKRPNVSCLI